jgi:predicted dehydrogenase
MTTSRRQFIAAATSTTAALAAASAIPAAAYAGEDNTIRLALIGSGSRGSGAVANAFETTCGPVKLHAMADLFPNRLELAHKALTRLAPDKVDVPKDRQFVGFDAYKHAIDTLRPGDIAMITGYAAWRPLQLEYAVQKGINVFMEKSFATDPFGARRVIAAAELAEKKNLKIAAGLMCRHSRNRQELMRRIHAGELGDILMIRSYRMHPSGFMRPKSATIPELEWQIRNFTKFLWVAGGLWAEMDIHQIDELCWLKDDHYPVSAHGLGGRAANNDDCSQNLDTFHVEWTFPDGAKGYHDVRYIPKCHNEFATYVHGTKAAAQFSGDIHAGTVRIYKDQRIAKDNIAWEAPKEEFTAWQQQWNDFIPAIRNDSPFNQAKRAALTNVADMMGRAAIHTGQLVTWDETINSNFRWCDYVDTMTLSSEPPVKPDATGHYPVPTPGLWKEV